MAAIFDLRRTQTSDSIPTSLSVLPDPENMGIAVGITLLSCIRAEINVSSYVPPVNGRHLWFTTYAYVGQYSHEYLRVANPENMVLSLEFSC